MRQKDSGHRARLDQLEKRISFLIQLFPKQTCERIYEMFLNEFNISIAHIYLTLKMKSNTALAKHILKLLHYLLHIHM